MTRGRRPRARNPGRRPLVRRRGISIFEILIAFILLQTGMLISVQMLIMGSEFGARARRTTYAGLAAQAQLAYVVREVVPSLTPAQVAAAQDGVQVPEVAAPLPPPAGVSPVAVTGLTWQARIAVTDRAGLYDVAVTVHVPGRGGRLEHATLHTRVYAPEDRPS